MPTTETIDVARNIYGMELPDAPPVPGPADIAALEELRTMTQADD